MTDLDHVEPDAAIARYNVSMRRRRWVYFSVVGAVVVALVVVFAVAYTRGEANNTRLRTVANPPASLALQAPTTQPREVWRTGDRAALGDPQYGGTVVVYSAHTVRGLNARTGKQTWSYTRSNRTVCSALQIAGVTVAVYELAGNCDELTGLESDTGKRTWTRTLDFNGRPLFGHPTYQIDASVPTFLVTTPSVIYGIDPGRPGAPGGLDRFVYNHFGCDIERAAPVTVMDQSRVLISQDCSKPRCTSDLQFCGRGPQLLLRDGTGDLDDKNPKNPNRIIWNNIGDDDIPVAAGSFLAAANPTTGQLDTLDGLTGKPAGSIALRPAPSSFADASAIALAGRALVRAGGSTYLVRSGASTDIWSTPTPGPPAVSGNEDGTATPQTARISVPTATGARLLAGASGRTTRSFTLTPAPPRGSTVRRLGTGFLVTSSTGTVAYA